MLLYPEFLKTSANVWEGNDYIDYNPDQTHGIVYVEAAVGSQSNGAKNDIIVINIFKPIEPYGFATLIF